MVLGSLDDRIGRRSVLVLAIAMISLSTFAVGLVPDVSAIGVAGTFLVVLMLLLQGFSAGGEASAVFAFVSEHAPVNRRGLYNGWGQSGSAFSFLAGTIVIAIVSGTLSQQAFDDWGWRIPFPLALPLGIVAILIRLRLPESPVFAAIKRSGTGLRSPLAESFRTGWRQIVQEAGIAAVVFVSNYILLAYIPTFLHSYIPTFLRSYVPSQPRIFTGRC
jgi:MFS transporter, MHS family, proline/betaine transporter